MSKTIVFHCKDCGEIFFMAIKNEQTIKDSRKEIIQYLAEGHTMKEVDSDVVTIRLGNCTCVA